MDDEGETTEEDSTGNKQEMKPEEQQVISSPTSLLSSQNSIKKVTENIDLENIEIGDGNIEMKKIDSIKKKDGDESIIIMKHDVTKMNIPPPHFPRSSCKSRNRDSRRCQKHFREMIELHSIKNEKLEEREGNLRQRLEILECSMPAVMIWNIWRMSQNAEIPNMKQLIAKQFENLHTKCPKTTNSQHYDCRVRQIEAERKCAQRRINEARALWSEKEFALGEQKRKLEEAKKTQDEHRERIEKLKAEVQELRVQKAREKDADGDSCQTGECGEIKCKQWLGNVSSTTSVKSTDLECLTRIQDLAEAELCMKRNISELERREEAYMRTLQQADELWSKMETDVATTTSTLQEQLQLKASANQQLANRVCCLEDTIERLNKKLANCNQILKKEQIQRRDKIVGEDNCNADVESKFSLARISTCDQYTSSRELQQSKTNCNKGQSTRKIGTSSKISGITCRDEMLDKCLSSRKINQRDQTTLDKCKSLRDIATDCRGERLERSVSTRKIDTSSKDQMTMQKSSSKKIGTSRDKLTKCTSVNTMTRCASANTMTKCSSANAVTKCASASTMKKCASATTMTKCPSANKMAKCTSTNKMSDCTSVNKKTSSKEIPFSCRDERLPKCVSVKKVNIASKDQVKDRDEDQDYHSFDTSDSEGEPCAADFICNDQVFSPTGIDDDDDDEFQSTTSEMILKDDKEDKKNKKDDKANDDLNRTLVAKESFTQLSKPVPKDEDQIPLEVICTGGINKTDETNIESVEQISNIQESEDGESKKVPRAEERKTDQKLKHDDVAVPKAELKSWLQSTADFEKAIANCSKCSPNANDVKKLANSIRTYLQIPLEDVTEYERIKTVEILSETLNMQKTAENIEENLKHTEEQQSNKEPKLAEETEPDKEIEISEEPLTIIYDKKFRISNGKLEETVENIENEEKLSKEIEKSEKIALDEEIKEDIEEVYDQKSQKSDNENETQKKVEQSVKDTSPTEKLEEPLAKIDSLSALRNSVEKIEKKDVEYHQQLVTDEEKTERTNDKTELFSDGEKETDRKKEKEENLVSTDKSLHDEEEEMEHSSKDKEVLSESIENEDKLSNAGENDEFTEKPIIPDEKDKEEEKEEEENEEKEKKEDEKEQEEKIEEEPKKAITREKSQIMTESGPSIPEEAKLVIVKGAVTSSTGIIVEKPVKEDLEKELSLQTQKIGSEENAFKKIAKTDSDCICKPEDKPRETKSESIDTKITLRDKADESQESICICSNGKSKRPSKLRPKITCYIVRGSMSKRSDQISQNSQGENSELSKNRKKLSVIKVKDESTGTVVSVGQQTERKKIRKQSTHKGEIKSNQQGFMSSLNINNKSSDTRKEERNLKAKEFTCDICKKFISTNISSNDVIDNGSFCHIQASTLTQKLIGFQSEINTCCSCRRRQENSNSKFQTEETIEKREVGKQFYRGKAFAKSISRETIENHDDDDDDDVTRTTTMINLHFNKKFYTPTFEKSDPNCLEKLIKNKNNSGDKRQKSKVKKPQGKIIQCSQECNRENNTKTIDIQNSNKNNSFRNNIQNSNKNNVQSYKNNVQSNKNNIQSNKNNNQSSNRNINIQGNNKNINNQNKVKNINKKRSGNLIFSDIDSDCICEKSNSTSGKKLSEGEKQFKIEKNRSCHCDDSD